MLELRGTSREAMELEARMAAEASHPPLSTRRRYRVIQTIQQPWQLCPATPSVLIRRGSLPIRDRRTPIVYQLPSVPNCTPHSSENCQAAGNTNPAGSTPRPSSRLRPGLRVEI